MKRKRKTKNSKPKKKKVSFFFCFFLSFCIYLYLQEFDNKTAQKKKKITLNSSCAVKSSKQSYSVVWCSTTGRDIYITGSNFVDVFPQDKQHSIDFNWP